jgi:hypothetical protein
MSHPNQMAFVAGIRDRFPDSFVGKNVLEIGSLDINGSVRQFFKNCDYTGVDLGDGPGVDIVCKGHEVPFADRSFDTVISCECLEHDRYWVQTFQKMYDVCDGLLIMTCATTGRAEHGTAATSPEAAPFTNDYYRNLTAKDFRDNFDLLNMFRGSGFEVNNESSDLYFWGIR